MSMAASCPLTPQNLQATSSMSTSALSEPFYSAQYPDAINQSASRLPIKLNLTSHEEPIYQQLWRLAEPAGKDFLDGQQGADFLATSDLPHPTLHEIWRLADQKSTGSLSYYDFCIACRLVAHAQAGSLISEEHVFLEPRSIPQFNSAKISQFGSTNGERSATTHFPTPQMSSYVGSVFPSANSALENFSFMSNKEQLSSQSNLYTVSKETKEKYLSRMRSLPLDAQGYLPGDVAKQFLSQSGLSAGELSSIWNLADVDIDGRLSAREFVIAMQLISARRKGFPIPSSMPRELESSAQCDTSNADASLATFSWSTNMDNSSPTSFSGMTSGDQDWASPSPFKIQMSDTNFTENFDSSIEKFPDFNSAFSNQENDCKLKPSKSFGDLVESERLKPDLESSDVSIEDLSPPQSKISKGSVNMSKSKHQHSKKKKIITQTDTSHDVKTVYKLLLQNDSDLINSLKAIANDSSSKINQLSDIKELMKNQLKEEKAELHRQLSRNHDFESQIHDLKVELSELQEQRRNVEFEKLCATRDLNFFQDEILFLRQQVEDTSEDIKALLESNEASLKCLRLAETQTRQLDNSRKSILSQIETHSKLLREQESEILELKKLLSHCRKEKEDVYAKHAVLQEKLRQAEQDRSLLLLSTESERGKLDEMYRQRLDASENKIKMLQLLTDVNHGAWSSDKGLSENIISGLQPAVTVENKLNQKYGKPLPRDGKGVPAGASVLVPAVGLPTLIEQYQSNNPSATATKFKSQFMSADTVPSFWTSFKPGKGCRTGKTTPYAHYASAGYNFDSRISDDPNLCVEFHMKADLLENSKNSSSSASSGEDRESNVKTKREKPKGSNFRSSSKQRTKAKALKSMAEDSKESHSLDSDDVSDEKSLSCSRAQSKKITRALSKKKKSNMAKAGSDLEAGDFTGLNNRNFENAPSFGS